VCAALAFAVACGGGGEGNGAQDVPTPLLSQEAGSPGDSSQVGSGELVAVRVGGHEIRVEIADDASERERGLMYRESLPEDQGMLFVYASQQVRSFWMRNTLIPLDIAFIDPDGLIVDVQQMQPQTDELTTSRYPMMYALEMNLGWFETNGVEVGDRLEF
jgi:uncharacterized membrane protein (UPF0127 family)